MGAAAAAAGGVLWMLLQEQVLLITLVVPTEAGLSLASLWVRLRIPPVPGLWSSCWSLLLLGLM